MFRGEFLGISIETRPGDQPELPSDEPSRRVSPPKPAMEFPGPDGQSTERISVDYTVDHEVYTEVDFEL
ncbi:MAG TPA: hypothetical protein VH234_05040 [Candidatus Saccharimonadales bacterium]|jgi:hypothetical protein|nr:hypothetical protein [Candidatus Saccharimonadales bacterium]